MGKEFEKSLNVMLLTMISSFPGLFIFIRNGGKDEIKKIGRQTSCFYQTNNFLVSLGLLRNEK